MSVYKKERKYTSTYLQYISTFWYWIRFIISCISNNVNVNVKWWQWNIIKWIVWKLNMLLYTNIFTWRRRRWRQHQQQHYDDDDDDNDDDDDKKNNNNNNNNNNNKTIQLRMFNIYMTINIPWTVCLNIISVCRFLRYKFISYCFGGVGKMFCM